MIVEDKDSYQSADAIDLKRIIQFLSIYKFPLLLSTAGFLFLLMGVIYAVRTQNTTAEVVFSEASSSAKVKVQVDVEGAVMSPGVYEVEEGSRITAVLASAGGLAADADRDWIAKNMNLAAKVVDGGKIYIPTVAEIGGNKTQNLSDLSNPSNLLGVTTGKVNINTSSQSELEGLPGVGPVTAGKIISGRPYQTIEELKSKKAVGQALFEKIKDLIVAL